MIMSYVTEAVVNYLGMKTNGALLISGDWGSGKTFHLKNEVLPAVESLGKYIPIVVSVYGEKDRNSIARKVLLAYADKTTGEKKWSLAQLGEKLQTISSSIPILKKYVDLEKLIVGTGDGLLSLLPKEKILICFDDFERLSDEVKADDFLGLINDLVEGRGVKVLLVANEDEIKNGLLYKEKTIEKTIFYTPDMSSVLDSLIGTDEDSQFKKYLTDNKEFILQSLNYDIDDESEQEELRKSLTNIRTVRFALEHFKKVFKLLRSSDSNDDEVLKTKLKNLWLFTLATSVECRKPNSLTFFDRKNIDHLAGSVSDLDFSLIDLADIQPKSENGSEVNEWMFAESFKSKYFSRHSIEYIFHCSVYELVVAGKEIQKEDFLKDLDESFNVKEGQIQEGHKILNSFLHDGWWKYSNEEFQNVLSTLLEQAEDGNLGDLSSFLNAAVFTIGFADIINVDKDTIVEKINQGVSKFLASTSLSPFLASQYQIVKGSYDDEHVKSVISHIDEELKKSEVRLEEEKLQQYSNLFKTDIGAFVKHFIPGDSSIKLPVESVFHKIEESEIIEAIKTWPPQGIMDFTSFLRIRYIQTSDIGRLYREHQFLKSIEKGIAEIDLSIKTLSNHVVEKHLIPCVTSCIARFDAIDEGISQILEEQPPTTPHAPHEQPTPSP